MGVCQSQAQTVGTTTFHDKYIYPAEAKHYDIGTGGFVDMWGAITDWSNKQSQGLERFKRLIHSYTQVNVCTEKHIILYYAGQSWVFHTRYNTDINPYRVIRL